MSDVLEVFSEGEILEGWKSVSIVRGFDRLAGSFGVSIAETNPLAPTDRRLLRGAEMAFRLDGELVLSGVVRKRTKQYTATGNGIELGGRDIVVDVIDCSAIAEPGQWLGASIASVAGKLLEPFPSLRFRADLSVPELGSVSDFSLETGETVFSALDRLARLRGLLLATDQKGGIYFTRAGLTRAPIALEYGTNIEAGTLTEDDSERFSRYIFNAQAPGVESWDTGDGPGQSVRVESTDPGVSRSRPLILNAEAAAGEDELRNRANFEASIRAARSVRVGYTLPNWSLDGYLWNPGDVIPVFDPMLGIGTAGGSPIDLLLASVEFSRDASGAGSTSKLDLYLPGSFSVLPVTKPKKEGLDLWEI